MNEQERQNKMLELALLLKNPTWDIPEQRAGDLGWLRRNLGIRNSNHLFFDRAKKLIEELSQTA